MDTSVREKMRGVRDNLQKAATVAKQKAAAAKHKFSTALDAALEGKATAAATTTVLADSRVAGPATTDRSSSREDLLRRLIDVADVTGVERAIRATGISEGELQELAGRLFMLIFHESAAGNEDGATAGAAPRIRSTRALSALMQLLPTLPPELSGFYLASLQPLIGQSAANAEVACSAGVIGTLLQWLPRLLPGGDCSQLPRQPADAMNTELTDSHEAVQVGAPTLTDPTCLLSNPISILIPTPSHAKLPPHPRLPRRSHATPHAPHSTHRLMLRPHIPTTTLSIRRRSHPQSWISYASSALIGWRRTNCAFSSTCAEALAPHPPASPPP